MQKLMPMLFLISGVITYSCASNGVNIPREIPVEQTIIENTQTIDLAAYTSTTLEITRNEKKYSVLLGYDIGEAFFHATPRPIANTSDWYGDIRNVSSAGIQRYGDFDNDGENEYLVSIYGRETPGYSAILVIDYDQTNDEYKVFDELVFEFFFLEKLLDIEKDGNPEIIGKDEFFFYESGGKSLESLYAPIKIFRYNGKEFIDVTKEYPNLIEKDVTHWLEGIYNDAGGQGQFKSIYAAYLADMYLLEKKDEGIAVFSEQCNNRLLPYIKSQKQNSTWNCEEFLISVKDALSKSGYD